jgi:hypothetical protein
MAQLIAARMNFVFMVPVSSRKKKGTVRCKRSAEIPRRQKRKAGFTPAFGCCRL